MTEATKVTDRKTLLRVYAQSNPSDGKWVVAKQELHERVVEFDDRPEQVLDSDVITLHMKGDWSYGDEAWTYPGSFGVAEFDTMDAAIREWQVNFYRHSQIDIYVRD